MKNKTKAYITCITAFLVMSLAMMSVVAGAGSITLTPASQSAGASVSVAGTGFGATQAVGIGFGQEVVVTGENHTIDNPTGTGPFTVIANHYPFKPGSFSFHCTVTSSSNVVESDYTDNGDGTLTSSSTYALNPFVNYVTGAFGRSTTSAWDGYTVVFTASYTYYQYNVTPATGVTTSASGAFTASITVPNVAAGTYTVTAIDTSGNRATSSLTVTGAIPETLTIGVVAVLSTFVTLVSIRYFREQPKIRKLN